MKLLINGIYADIVDGFWNFMEPSLYLHILYTEKFHDMFNFSLKENLPLCLEIFTCIGKRDIHVNLDIPVSSYIQDTKILKVWF